jgi:hypothetical protein
VGPTRQAESRSVGAPAVTWARDFPGTPEQAGKARRFLAAVLGNRPAADDAILCLSELASNPCLHSRTRRPGGRFTVRAALNARELGWKSTTTAARGFGRPSLMSTAAGY